MNEPVDVSSLIDCDYMDVVAEVTRRIVANPLPPGVHDLAIEHEEWCPMSGGRGGSPCHVQIVLDGKIIYPETVA